MKTAPQRIAPRSADLGEGFVIRRALPTRERRMVGAWCFLDHAGPIDFPAGGGMHVGAHPHIGLQTFTWLIDGEILHRDSLGNEQVIRPGQVNLMTAGHGIVHTEDSLPGTRHLHAAQLWIALPYEQRDCPPAFAHYPDLPRWQEAGATLTLLAGSHAGQTAPTRLHSPLLGLDLHSPAASTVTLPLRPGFEYGLLVLDGNMQLAGEAFKTDEFAYLSLGNQALTLQLAANSRVLLLGGEPFDKPVLMWWNFVGHNQNEIITAQEQWEAGDPRFGPVGDAPRLPAPPLPWQRK